MFPVVISEWVSRTQGTENWIQMGKGAFAYFSADLLPGGHLQAQPEQEELGGIFGIEISTF